MPKIILFFILCLPSIILAKTIPATQLKSTQAFIDNMVQKHHFDKQQLQLIFSQISLTIRDKKLDKKTKKKAKKPMPWDKYRSLFITKDRIENGLKFWQKNSSALKRAQEKYNVPSEIIVAILGVETNYGNNQGSHPTLETLTKRAFGNYRRRNFYKTELENFLLMVRENAFPPLSISGSYAGAMGYAQFIASSYRHYAVDFNQDGAIDLFSDPVDSIGSIANYFDQHHWHDFGEIARPIQLTNTQTKMAKRSTVKPKKTAQYWRQNGFNIDADINNKTKLDFIQLNNEKTNETWLTFWNFYILTRYNHDNRYAMVVYQLSEQLKQQFTLKNP